MNARAHRAIALVPQVASAATVLIGAVVLVGWAYSIPSWIGVLPGLVPMNPLTAVAFILAAISLWLSQAKVTPGERRLAKGLALAVVGISAVRWSGYLFDFDPGLDHILFSERLAEVPFGPNRMAPNTALGFTFFGLALLLIDREIERPWRPAEILALLGAVPCLVAITGYAYSEGQHARLGGHIPMALNTAVAFLLLAAGILFLRPGRGLMAIVLSDHAGGVAARRLLPAAIGVPWALGWLRVAGERADLYGPAFGVSLLAVATTCVLFVAVCVCAYLLGAVDDARERAIRALRESEGRLQAILDNAPSVVQMKDLEGRLLFVNRRFEEVFRSSREYAIGKTDHEILPGPVADRARAKDAEVLERRGVLETEEDVPLDDGVHTYLALRFPLLGLDGAPYATCDISTDITPRKRMERSLLERSAQAEAANRELEAFSYSVSHDLRAPLRAIDGFARILRDDHASRLDAEASRVLGVICDNSRRMGQLIDDLLAFSRVGRARLEKMAFDMDALAHEVADELRRHEPGRTVSIGVAPLGRAVGDPSLIRQVLINLLANAFKFTRRRAAARIEVGCSAQPGEVVYHVRDNGEGFDPRYGDKLFGVFQRLHRESEFEGTGVGLALVQRIVQRHGGRVWAEGEVGRGATFHFTLPAGEGEAPWTNAP